MTGIALLHCAETIKGGIASYLRELIPLQVESLGIGMVAVVIPRSQCTELPLPEGVELHTFDDEGGRVSNAVLLAKKACSLTRQLRPRVVHVHSTFAGATIRPALALLFPHTRVVYCAHGWAWDRPMSKFARAAIRLVERILAYASDQIICISDHERRAAIDAGLPAQRMRVVLNGVGSVRALTFSDCVNWPDGELRLLFVGRFDHQKGPDLFCEALRLLGGRAAGLMAGGAVLGDSNVLDMPTNVRSIGWVSPGKLEALFDSADVLVMPSRWEGFGLTAAEAMRAGLAVIATRVGGLPEVIEDGVTGVLVEAGRAEEIAHVIEQQDRERLSEMGDQGRRRFDRMFRMERVRDELNEVYGFGGLTCENMIKQR